MKTSRILELAGLPNQNAKLLESEELAEHYPGTEHYPKTPAKKWPESKKDFSYNNKKLTFLNGLSPSSVVGDFSCHGNKLTSLEGAPTKVGGTFICDKNNLTSLKGAPSSVGDTFYCHSNNITSLEGAPSSIGGEFSCNDNKLTSLHNIHKQIKHIGGIAAFEKNPIKSHVLGLLEIDGLKGVLLDNIKVQRIVNKHLKGDRDVVACQKELIDAGFEDFAQL